MNAINRELQRSVQETRRGYRRLWYSLFAVLARDLQALLEVEVTAIL